MKASVAAFLFTMLSLVAATGYAQTATWTPPGPAVGSTFPEPLALQDQSGKPQTLKALLGSNGAAVFFVRSADWCPFCKKQLVELNTHLAGFKALGLNVISVSHDTPQLLEAFHAAQRIGFTMLADPDGKAVENLGIRDLQYADGSRAYGVARPMIFIVNAQRKITHKYAEESYRGRPDLAKVLSDLNKK